MHGEKLDRNNIRILFAILNKSWKHHSTKQSLYSYLLPTKKKQTSKQDRWDMWGTVGDTRTNSLVTISYELLQVDIPVLADLLRLALCGQWMQPWIPARSDRLLGWITKESQVTACYQRDDNDDDDDCHNLNVRLCE